MTPGTTSSTPSRYTPSHGSYVQEVIDPYSKTSKPAELTMLAELGQGAFSVCKMILTLEEDGSETVVAVKCPNNNVVDRVEKEVLTVLSYHPNIVVLKYYYIRHEVYHLVLNYSQGGDFFSFIHGDHVKHEVRKYAELYIYQLFRALAYCHSRDVVHRDVKPENLLVNVETGRLRLTDFGCATFMREPGAAHVNYVGTREFRSPELLFGSVDYSNKVDVWAATVVLSEVLLGQPVFMCEATTSEEQGRRIMEYLGPPKREDWKAMNIDVPRLTSQPEKKYSLESEFYEFDSSSLLALLNRTFIYDPDQRLSAWEVCGHAYFSLLYDKHFSLENGSHPQYLFNFSEYEMLSMPEKVWNRLKGLMCNVFQTSNSSLFLDSCRKHSTFPSLDSFKICLCSCNRSFKCLKQNW